MATVSGMGVFIGHMHFTSESPFHLGLHVLTYHHNNKNCSDTGWKRDETVKREYVRKPPGLAQRRSNAVYEQDRCLSPAVGILTITKKNDKGVFGGFRALSVNLQIFCC